MTILSEKGAPFGQPPCFRAIPIPILIPHPHPHPHPHPKPRRRAAINNRTPSRVSFLQGKRLMKRSLPYGGTVLPHGASARLQQLPFIPLRSTRSWARRSRCLLRNMQAVRSRISDSIPDLQISLVLDQWSACPLYWKYLRTWVQERTRTRTTVGGLRKPLGAPCDKQLLNCNRQASKTTSLSPIAPPLHSLCVGTNEYCIVIVALQLGPLDLHPQHLPSCGL